MALDPVVNFFRSTIATLPVASGGTSIVLQTGDGNKLPAPAIDGAFNLTIYNADDPFVAPEIVRVTARSGDTLTVTRAQEGTSATNKTSGSTWNVELTPTAKTIQDIDSAKLDVAGGTMTGDLTIPDKIIHSGDTNTAIRFPANDTVTVETAGVERFRVGSTGLIGIANNNPTFRLDITNPSGSGIRLAGSDISTNALISGLTRGARIGANSTSSFIEGVDNTGVASFQPFTVGGLDIRFATQGVANEKMRITSTGNVGIGTTTPATLLDVNGDVTITDKIIHSGDTNTAIRFPSADTVSVETNGSEALRVSSQGDLRVGTTADLYGGASALGYITLTKGIKWAGGGRGPIQIVGGSIINLTGTTGKIVYTFKSTNAALQWSAFVTVSGSTRTGSNTPSHHTAWSYSFVLHHTSAGVSTIHNIVANYEWQFVQATHFAFTDLGSGESKVELTNPTVFTQNGFTDVKVMTYTGVIYIDTITVV